MIRLVMLMVAVVAFGCAAKPSEEDCRSAISNMQTLMGTDTLSTHEMVESQVRRCKGGSTKKSVDCAIKATTLDQLRECDFYKVPENAKGIGAPPGAGSAGSAAAGSAAAGSAGSAAAGSAGSAADGAAGSAGAGSAGSAGSAAGSGETGSAGSAAAGSAGSAAP